MLPPSCTDSTGQHSETTDLDTAGPYFIRALYPFEPQANAIIFRGYKPSLNCHFRDQTKLEGGYAAESPETAYFISKDGLIEATA